MLGIGKFDRRITIQQTTDIRDEFGAGVPAWSTFATVWANAAPSGGNEKTEGQKITATGIVLFTIRYIAGIDEKMQIVYNGDTYNITNIDEPDRRRSLLITANKKL